jgi:hypothetical protein
LEDGFNVGFVPEFEMMTFGIPNPNIARRNDSFGWMQVGESLIGNMSEISLYENVIIQKVQVLCGS